MIFVKTFTLAVFGKFKNLPKETAQFSTFLTQNIDFLLFLFTELEFYTNLQLYIRISCLILGKATVKSQKMFNEIRNFTQLGEILH